jgi:hypothetical protein
MISKLLSDLIKSHFKSHFKSLFAKLLQDFESPKKDPRHSSWRTSVWAHGATSEIPEVDLSISYNNTLRR